MPTPSAADLVRIHLRESADLLSLSAERTAEDLDRAAEQITASLRAGGKLLLCGNGGSAAQCQHLAAEFVNLLDRGQERPGLAAIALTADSSALTATANDRGYAEVFARQIQALGRPGDVVLAMSTSGSSPNIVQAMSIARARGLVTILLTGAGGGEALPHAQLSIQVPSLDTQHIQEVHLALGHALVGIIVRRLFPGLAVPPSNGR